jgi:hypothetical protein
MVAVENHGDFCALADVEDFGGAETVFVVFEGETIFHARWEIADDSDEFVAAAGFAAVDIHEAPGGLGEAHEIEREGVFFEDLAAVVARRFILTVEDDELIGVQDDTDAEEFGAAGDAGQEIGHGAEGGLADGVITHGEEGADGAVEANVAAMAVAEGPVEALEVVPIDVVENEGSLGFWEREVAGASDGSEGALLVGTEADQAEGGKDWGRRGHEEG